MRHAEFLPEMRIADRCLIGDNDLCFIHHPHTDGDAKSKGKGFGARWHVDARIL